MIRRLLLITAVATLLLAAALPGLPALTSPDGSASGRPGVAYADDVDPTPTPAATPAPPDGSCHGSGQCGD